LDRLNEGHLKGLAEIVAHTRLRQRKRSHSTWPSSHYVLDRELFSALGAGSSYGQNPRF
jgi:hypothetical protein